MAQYCRFDGRSYSGIHRILDGPLFHVPCYKCSEAGGGYISVEHCNGGVMQTSSNKDPAGVPEHMVSHLWRPRA